MRPLPTDIAQLIDQAAARHGVDRFLARAVAWAESRGKADARSDAGALGVMQLMPGTASGLGVDDPFDPAQNIDGGVRYLAKLLATYDVASALAGYVWGPANVKRKPDDRDWPEKVRTYVNRVLDRAVEERTAAHDGPPTPAPSSTSSAPSSSSSSAALLGVAAVLAFGLVYVVLLAKGGKRP